jgi:hypothetical protein
MVLVTMYNTFFIILNYAVCRNYCLFMGFLWIYNKSAIVYLNVTNRLTFVMEMLRVYFEGGIDSKNLFDLDGQRLRSVT